MGCVVLLARVDGPDWRLWNSNFEANWLSWDCMRCRRGGRVAVNSVSVACASATEKRHGRRNWKSYNYSVPSFFIVL